MPFTDVDAQRAYWRGKEAKKRLDPVYRERKVKARQALRVKRLRADEARVVGSFQRSRMGYYANRLRVERSVKGPSGLALEEMRVRDRRRRDREQYYRLKERDPVRWRERAYRSERRRRARELAVVSGPYSRQEIYERDGGRCHYCAKRVGPDWHLAHLVALVAGGSDTRDNVAVSCPGCNLTDGPGRLAVQLRLAA